MPYTMTSKSAGDEISSTYEGRHVECQESDLVHPYHSDGFVDKGDPVLMGDLVGVAFKDAAVATDIIAVDTEGIWALSVVAADALGNSAVARGDRIYIHKTAATLSKYNEPGIYMPFGIALSTLSSGTTGIVAVKVHQDPLPSLDDSYIVVSKAGNDTYSDGSFRNPFLTITKAFTMVTNTRKTIFVLPGDYAEAAILTWPNINGLQLIGMEDCGNVVISNSNGATSVIDIDPTFTTATFEAFLENICVSHDAQIGIQIDNTNMTRKLLVHLKNVSSEQVSTGDSIDIPHTTAGQAIRVYAEDCNEIEGLVDIAVKNTDDRFRFWKCALAGGLTTSADAIAAELELHCCTILTNTLTIGNAAMVLTYRASMYRTDAGVYTELADGYSS